MRNKIGWCISFLFLTLFLPKIAEACVQIPTSQITFECNDGYCNRFYFSWNPILDVPSHSIEDSNRFPEIAHYLAHIDARAPNFSETNGTQSITFHPIHCQMEGSHQRCFPNDTVNDWNPIIQGEINSELEKNLQDIRLKIGSEFKPFIRIDLISEIDPIETVLQNELLTLEYEKLQAIQEIRNEWIINFIFPLVLAFGIPAGIIFYSRKSASTERKIQKQLLLTINAMALLISVTFAVVFTLDQSSCAQREPGFIKVLFAILCAFLLLFLLPDGHNEIFDKSQFPELE